MDNVAGILLTLLWMAVNILFSKSFRTLYGSIRKERFNLYEKFMVQKEQFQNTCRGGEVIGFEFGLTITAYHGKVLEDIRRIEVRVDGIEYPESAITFHLRGRSFTQEQMRQESVFRWEFAEVATIRVACPGGLSEGYHELYVNQVHNASGADGANAFTQTLKLRSSIRRGVSLYSYQQEVYKGILDLEGEIKAVHDLNADGIEILTEEMVPGFPNPSEYFVEKFKDLMEKYKMRAVCYDASSASRFMARSANPDYAAAAAKLRDDIRLAKRLGFDRIRCQSPFETMVECLPFAEENGIILATEIHSPAKFTDKRVTEICEYVDKTGTKFLGLIPDTGIFIPKPVRLVYERHLRRGATPELIEYSVQAYMSGCSDREKNYEDVKRMGGNEIDLYYAREVFDYVNNDPADLTALVPYIVNVHGKLYEMTEDYEEYSIPFPAIIDALKAGNYGGYICSEYEGQRHYHDLRDFDVDSVEQVRRQHVMLERLIEG